MIIGIDFGTCFSSVAIMKGPVPVTSYTNRISTKQGIPTRFMYSRLAGKELFGKETKVGEAYKNPRDVIKNIKRMIRADPDNLKVPVVSGGKEYLLSDVIEHYLGYLIENAKAGAMNQVDNTEIEAITVTVPVGIRPDQIMASDYNKLILDAVMEITGLPEDKVRILEEPVAASISYFYGENLRSRIDSSKTILVFDLGGGTLDVTIMTFNPDSLTYTTEAKEGDLNLGGNDFDERIISRVYSEMGIDGFDNPEELIKFEDAISNLKMELSEIDNSMLMFKRNGKFACLEEYTRETFESDCADLVERCRAVVDRALETYSDGLSGIDKIVLVGGGSNMPMIRRMIESEYGSIGLSNILVHEPSTAISRGAAIYAKLCEESQGVSIIQTISHTYGFESRDSSTGDFRIYNLLFKGMAFSDSDVILQRAPTSFVALHKDQESIRFAIYESDYFVKPEEMIGEYRWSDFEMGESDTGIEVVVPVPQDYLGRADEYSCFVEMSIDKNNIIGIRIFDAQRREIGYDSNYLKKG